MPHTSHLEYLDSIDLASPKEVLVRFLCQPCQCHHRYQLLWSERLVFGIPDLLCHEHQRNVQLIRTADNPGKQNERCNYLKKLTISFEYHTLFLLLQLSGPPGCSFVHLGHGFALSSGPKICTSMSLVKRLALLEFDHTGKNVTFIFTNYHSSKNS